MERRSWMGTERLLDPRQAKRFYDRLGSGQDRQAWYEDRANGALFDSINWSAVNRIAEFGCGTGRVAGIILDRYATADATWVGFDQAATMTKLARRRLGRFGERTQVVQTDGRPVLDLPDSSVDLFLSTYVFDLLPLPTIDQLLAEARRVLRPGGTIGLTGLTPGSTAVARIVSGVWQRIHRLNPLLVGGCRPLELLDQVKGAGFGDVVRKEVRTLGLASEIIRGESRNL